MPSLRLVPQQSLREVAQLQPEELALLTEPPAPMCPRVATVRVMGSTLVQPIWLRYDLGVVSFISSYRNNGQGVTLPNAAVVSVCLSERANGQRRVVVEGTIEQVSRRRHPGGLEGAPPPTSGLACSGRGVPMARHAASIDDLSPAVG